MTKQQEKAVQALEYAAWWREKNAPPTTPYPYNTPGRMLQEQAQAQSIREALRVFFLVLTLALLGGCASQVDIEYTPEQVCQRWCEDRETCDPVHATPECMQTCSVAVHGECGAAQRALRTCIVDTDEIRGACGFEGCRCQEELEAARRCGQ